MFYFSLASFSLKIKWSIILYFISLYTTCVFSGSFDILIFILGFENFIKMWLMAVFMFLVIRIHSGQVSSVQFSSVAQLCLTLCDPMNCSTPGLPVHHQLLEFTQTNVHRVRDAIQPSHPRSSLSPTAPNPSKHQSLFQWVNSLHEVAKVLEFQL